jgi:hypothetical protein
MSPLFFLAIINYIIIATIRINFLVVVSYSIKLLLVIINTALLFFVLIAKEIGFESYFMPITIFVAFCAINLIYAKLKNATLFDLRKLA